MRAVVPNKSKNEIVLVLQHFENCVDKTVQAFLEGMRMSVSELDVLQHVPTAFALRTLWMGVICEHAVS